MNGDEWSYWPSPAKLNLFLHITGRRDDGYHTLQTVFQLLDWGDSVGLRLRTDARIVRHGDVPGIAADDDLCIRAARLLQQRIGDGHGADIALAKQIPVGGGLGGGSSNAATVLIALNELWSGGLDVDALSELGLQLGADVPVFVRGHSAFAEGIGEILTPVQLPERWFLVVAPGVHAPTAALFQSSELTRDTPATTIPRFLAGEITCNAFQTLVRRQYPAVERALAWLEQSGAARLSGSGASVFLPLRDADQGNKLLAELPADMRAVVTRGVNRSPLLDAVAGWRQTGKTGFGWDVAKR
ncbi:MAG: 4-(cytidine 5'-diphospho)-2-C-methyl-D-erythritol kinase [Dokdonella sp.]